MKRLGAWIVFMTVLAMVILCTRGLPAWTQVLCVLPVAAAYALATAYLRPDSGGQSTSATHDQSVGNA